MIRPTRRLISWLATPAAKEPADAAQERLEHNSSGTFNNTSARATRRSIDRSIEAPNAPTKRQIRADGIQKQAISSCGRSPQRLRDAISLARAEHPVTKSVHRSTLPHVPTGRERLRCCCPCRYARRTSASQPIARCNSVRSTRLSVVTSAPYVVVSDVVVDSVSVVVVNSVVNFVVGSVSLVVCRSVYQTALCKLLASAATFDASLGRNRLPIELCASAHVHERLPPASSPRVVSGRFMCRTGCTRPASGIGICGTRDSPATTFSPTYFASADSTDFVEVRRQSSRATNCG